MVFLFISRAQCTNGWKSIASTTSMLKPPRIHLISVAASSSPTSAGIVSHIIQLVSVKWIALIWKISKLIRTSCSSTSEFNSHKLADCAHDTIANWNFNVMNFSPLYFQQLRNALCSDQCTSSARAMLLLGRVSLDLILGRVGVPILRELHSAQLHQQRKSLHWWQAIR